MNFGTILTFQKNHFQPQTTEKCEFEDQRHDMASTIQKIICPYRSRRCSPIS